MSTIVVTEWYIQIFINEYGSKGCNEHYIDFTQFKTSLSYIQSVNYRVKFNSWNCIKYMNKTANNMFILTICVVIAIYVNIKRVKYYAVNFSTKITRRIQQEKYKDLYLNFDELCGPIRNLPYKCGTVDCSRSGNAQYSMLDLSDMVIDASYNCIDNILLRILPFINLNNKGVTIDQLVVVDIINTYGSYFPSIHTDIEWNYYPMNGFQVWVLISNENHDKGNMFFFETNDAIAGGGNSVNIEDKCFVCERKKERKTIELKNTARYVNIREKNCVFFNQNMLHMSDFRQSDNTRHALNFRVLVCEDGRKHVHTSFENQKLDKLNEHFFKRMCPKNECQRFSLS